LKTLAVSDLSYASLPSPLGELWLAATPRGLCRLAFSLDEAGFLALVTREIGLAPRRGGDTLTAALRQLNAYFAGRLRTFDLPLDLARGTSFQLAVWQATGRIPYGQVCSYGDMARALQSARALRAVGQALGHNPLPIIVPCHRVLRSDGTLGGYTGGLDIKKTLLSLEGYAWRCRGQDAGNSTRPCGPN
jgi:methylated-DNA-[protein]-cysteine S-methyltransferase